MAFIGVPWICIPSSPANPACTTCCVLPDPVLGSFARVPPSLQDGVSILAFYRHGQLGSVRAGTRVLKSASELFAVIKKSLLRCSKYITRGAAMLALMGAFQVGMQRTLLLDVSDPPIALCRCLSGRCRSLFQVARLCHIDGHAKAMRCRTGHSGACSALCMLMRIAGACRGSYVHTRRS